MRKNVLLRVNYPSGRKWMLTVEKDNLRVHTRWYEDGNIMLKSVDNSSLMKQYKFPTILMEICV